MLLRLFTIALVLACFSVLAACSGSSDGGSGGIAPGLTPQGRIVTLDANGDVPDVGIDTGSGSNSASFKRIVNGGGFAYQMGRVRNSNEFLGVAGILPNSQVGASPTVATATYSGRYDLAYADGNRFDRNVSGNITLDADFNGGTLTGQSGGLTVNGSITGQRIGGTASYGGVNAGLTGRIGNDRAVGAFAGNTNRKVLAGGFIAERDN